MAIKKPSIAERLAEQQRQKVAKRKAEQNNTTLRKGVGGLTAKQILKATPTYIKYNGGFVTPTKIKFDPQTKTYICETVTKVLGEPERKHKQSIQVVKGEKLSDRGAFIKISCDCDFHCYTCEVALNRWGASDIVYSNGEHPFVTNPRLVPSTCKHGFVLLSKLLKEGK